MEWFQNSSFWESTYPAMFPEARFANASEEIAKILRLTSFRGGSILDLCCGPGRHSLALAPHGRVTGVDVTHFLLEKARARAKEQGAPVEFVHGDMREFVRPATFDLAVNLFTSFGYFDTREEDLRVLRNLHASLKPGGELVIDVMGKEVLARIFKSVVVDELPDGALLVMWHEVVADWSRIRNRWIIQRVAERKEFTFEHNIYSAQELSDALRAAGFSAVKIHGSYEGTPYDDKARRLIAVARR